MDSFLARILPIFVIIFGTLIVGWGIWYGIRQNKSLIERSKKIDPSVKTVTEAHYVLKKDIAKNFGNDNN